MSSVREFQRMDAATGNERRPTVDRRNDGTRSEWLEDERSRRRPGRSAIRVSWLRYGGARPCSTRYAMTATLKSTRSSRRNQCSCFGSTAWTTCSARLGTISGVTETAADYGLTICSGFTKFHTSLAFGINENMAFCVYCKIAKWSTKYVAINWLHSKIVCNLYSAAKMLCYK